MGIDPIDSTENPGACSTNQSVIGAGSPCVQLGCESHRLASQTQPMPASPGYATVAGVAAIARLKCQYQLDAGFHLAQGFRRQATHLLRQQALVQRDQLRHVDYGVVREVAGTTGKSNVARSGSQTGVRSYSRTDRGADRTFIELVRLHDKYRPPESGPGTPGVCQRGPPDLSPPHYHFSFGRDSSWALASSGSRPDSSALPA